MATNDRKMKVYCYALRHGPDSRHLTESSNYKRLKDAMAAVKALPEGRAYRLWKLVTDGTWGHLADGGTIKEVIK